MTTLAIVFVLAVAALLHAERTGARRRIAVAKMTAASCFVGVALACGALESSYGRILLGGLAACWLGDALLLSRGRSRAFQLGIAAFLVGHLAYACAFAEIGVDPFGLLAGGLGVAGAAALTTRWLRPHVPKDFRLPVVCYVGVISAMVAMSIGVVAAGGPLVIAVGALGFAASDVSVARDRFVAPGFANAAWGLPLYFGSQALLAGSVRLVSGAA